MKLNSSKTMVSLTKTLHIFTINLFELASVYYFLDIALVNCNLKREIFSFFYQVWFKR